ncbi:MAG TPA: tetratricopeptide repeat protein [Terriglobales bacterium]|nr:tetratricopeptide repeat protein [Terriglobales bacterium]
MRTVVETAFIFFLTVLLSAPGWAADKEILQLQTQVQNLQDQLSRLQRSLDENIGITADRMNRNADNIRQLQRSVQEMQNQLTQRSNTARGEIDGMNSQLKALQAAVNDVKNRLELATRPAAATQVPAQSGAIQVAAPPAQVSSSSPPPDVVAKQGPASAAPSQPANSAMQPNVQPPAVQPPDGATNNSSAEPMDLYEIAMGHYAAKDFESAANEFTRYLKTDRQSSKAINARFYLAEIEYQQQDFEGALDDYTEVGPRLSDPARAATAQYKKALCLLEVERQDEAIRELQSLIERYPHSVEASRAARKLRALKRPN